MWKYFKLAMLGKDAVVEYIKDTNEPNHIPIWLHRRFIGAVFTFIAGVLAIWGYKINVNEWVGYYFQIVPAAVGAYGSILVAIGHAKRNNNDRRIATHIAKTKQAASIKDLIQDNV